MSLCIKKVGAFSMLVGSEIRRFYKIENNISESCIRDRSRLPEKSYFLIKASWESLRDGL